MRTLLTAAPLAAGRVAIVDEEARHGRTVLRLRPGESVRLCDGHGRSAEAVVETVERHRLLCQVAAVCDHPRLPAEDLHLLVAPPKGGRLDDLVRALTELGVGSIQPLACTRTARTVNQQRLQRVAAEALKQCRRSRMPSLPAVTDLATLSPHGRTTIVLDTCGTPGPLPPPGPTTVVVGPEGGFSPEERAWIQSSGAGILRLGPTVLRIETAAVAAAAVIIHAWERHERQRPTA